MFGEKFSSLRRIPNKTHLNVTSAKRQMIFNFLNQRILNSQFSVVFEENFGFIF
jgi:hypothetical protein